MVKLYVGLSLTNTQESTKIRVLGRFCIDFLNGCFMMIPSTKVTPPKTNMSPKEGPFRKERACLPTTFFQGRTVSLRGSNLLGVAPSQDSSGK